MPAVFARENRVLLDILGRFEKALTRSSIDSMIEIVRTFEVRLSQHLRGQEALLPVLSKHLSTRGEPVARRRIEGGEHEERLRELRSDLQAGRWGKFVYKGQLFVTFLREYLRGADETLLPLARRLLTPEEWDHVRALHDSMRSAFAQEVAPQASKV